MLGAKPGDPSSTPETYMLEGDHRLQIPVLSPAQAHHASCTTPTHQLKLINNLERIFVKEFDSRT